MFDNFAEFINSQDFSNDVKRTIIDAHNGVITELSQQIEDYKSKSEELPELQAELQRLQEINSFDYEKEYEKLSEEFKTLKQEQKRLSIYTEKENAFKYLLREIGVTHIDSVCRASKSFIDALEVDSGMIRDSVSAINYIRSEWSDFIHK